MATLHPNTDTLSVFRLKVTIKGLEAEKRYLKRFFQKLLQAKGKSHWDGYSTRGYWIQLEIYRKREQLRNHLLVYAFLRGIAYKRLEAKCEVPPGVYCTPESIYAIARNYFHYYDITPDVGNVLTDSEVHAWLEGKTRAEAFQKAIEKMETRFKYTLPRELGSIMDVADRESTQKLRDRLKEMEPCPVTK